MLSRDNLHAYQERMIEFFKREKRAALFVFMGAGKSVTTLTAIVDLLDSFAVNKVLIIAPLRVANSVWKQECGQWEHLKHLKVSVCTGSERNRLAALQTSADIYTINRENVKWLVEHYGKKWPFDCVIIDESSSFKNASSQRFKALKKVAPLTNYMLLLTGTPSPNSLLELWPQLYLIDFGERLGRTMTGFKQRFFESDYMGYNWTIREGAQEKVQSLISDKCLSMTANDYLELPERIDIVENLVLPAKVLKQYIEFEKEMFIEFENSEGVEALNAASLANKLLQFSNGCLYTDELKNYEELHKVKLDALADLIEVNESENILVAYNYKSDLERLEKRFPDAVVLDKNQSTIDNWNNGNTKLLLAHPASAGHGLNIQRGGALIVWFGLNWSLELYQQFNARLHRQGQTKPVRIVHLVCGDTIDERVLSVLNDKDATQSKLIQALKR
jgi:SNF2 family DNA or RNA helicase